MMVEILNSKLEVTWSTADKLVLDEALALAAQGYYPTYAADMLQFLYRHSHAHVLMVAHKGEKLGTMTSLAFLLQGELVSEPFTYTMAGTPCAQVQKHEICYYPTKTQHLFPQDTFLTDFNIESYLAGPLLNSYGEIAGLIALMHQKPLPHPQLVELLLTILSPPLEAFLDTSA